MHKFLLALILLSLSVTTGAIAQQQRSGTPQERFVQAGGLAAPGDGHARNRS